MIEAALTQVGRAWKAGAVAACALVWSGAAPAQFNPAAPTVQDQPTAATADLGRNAPGDRVRANSGRGARTLGDIDPFATTLGFPMGRPIYSPIMSTVETKLGSP